MKTLEVLFTIILILSSISLTFRQRGVTKINLFVIAANYILLIGTIMTIGANWRMIPAYIVVLLLTLQVFVKPKITIVSKKLSMKIIKISGIVVAAFAMFTLPKLFPIMSFPEPTGEYTVGTQTFHLIDKNRKEFVVPNHQVNRELMIQVYYPAEKGTGQPSPYFEHMDALTEQLAATQGFPYIATTHLGLTKTHSYQDATPIKSKKNIHFYYLHMA